MPSRLTAQNKLVLVVEDHPIVQRAVQNMLINSGFQVHTANNGAQALTQVQSHDYDLLCLDLGLPDQEGCAVAKEIRSWQQQNQRPASSWLPYPPIWMKIRRRCLAAGMVSTFVKPLDVKKCRKFRIY